MALGRRAKTLSQEQEALVQQKIALSGRYRSRNQAMFLLSTKAGLRAKEIASLTWSMVLTPDRAIDRSIALENKAAKGRRGGRLIPIHPALRATLQELLDALDNVDPSAAIIQSERGGAMLPSSVVGWFGQLYQAVGLTGCSSHSGRRGFITQAARKIALVGGSVRDVQLLAGHSSLQTTQAYIDGNSEAQLKVVDLL